MPRIDLKELKKLCDEYDEAYGAQCESEYEGRAVYEFAVERSAKSVDTQPTCALMDSIHICRYTIDFTIPPKECGNYNNGFCDVDGGKCNSTMYIPAPIAQQRNNASPEGQH